MTILISHGDFVVVQEGQLDLPKIIILEEVTVTESSSLEFASGAFFGLDTVLTQDFSFLVIHGALFVFDSVTVREGQSDNLGIVALDSVTLVEDVALLTFPHNLSASDNVTIADVAVLAPLTPSTVSISVLDTLTTQESQTIRMAIYIFPFDVVTVIDGALNMDVEDSLTVTDDLTVKLARLVISAQDAVVTSELVELFGSSITTTSIEELLVAESVILLLTSIHPEAQDTVTVTDVPTVSITSIALSMNINDAVTVVEVIQTQTNPMHIVEFTEVPVEENIILLLSLLRIDALDTITIIDEPALVLSLLRIDTSDSVSLEEVIVPRIGKGKKRRKDFLVIGVGE